jgi:ankyrin repeat protein
MAKARPSIASNPALKGAAEVLNDLDTFLSGVGDEEEEKVQESDEITLDFGDTCPECRAGTSPMILAVKNGHTGCLKELLERNLDEIDLISVLSENGATLAHIAARKGDLEALKAVISADVSLCEVGDIRGATPLHVCAYHGRLDCLSCLLESGAEANLGDFDGATPVHFAAASGHLECLKKLVERGNGDPNAQTESGETPGIFLKIA